MTLTLALILALIAIAILVLGAVALDHRADLKRIEEIEMRSINSLTTVKQNIEAQIDNVITGHNATVTHYDKEIEETLARLEAIAADIKRLDTEVKYQQTKMNVVYPWFENSEYNINRNAGVTWAKDFPDQEVDHAE